MSRIAHLSDTHFGTEIPQVAEALREILDALQPELVVVTGDITQRARPREFAAARAFFERLRVPASLFMPGNHDIPLYNLFARAFDPYRNFRNAFGARSSIWNGEHATVIALDTTQRLRHTRGKLDLQQLSLHLAAAGQKARPGLIFAGVHQPLQTSWAQDRNEVLINSAEAAQAFSRHGIDLVLSGHVHVPMITTTRERFPGLARHFVLVGAGTAISHRTRPGAPNSFNLLTADDDTDRITVDDYRFDAENMRFMHKSRYCFQATDDGWIEEE